MDLREVDKKFTAQFMKDFPPGVYYGELLDLLELLNYTSKEDLLIPICMIQWPEYFIYVGEFN